MVTTIGLNPDFNVVLKDLISLDYDAADAYEAAIQRLQNIEFKQQITQFREDHLRHTRELSGVAKQLGLEPPDSTDLKVLITKGKVVVADIFTGDKEILMAMKTNEEDTNTAYGRAFNHKGMVPQALNIIERGLADERRHRAWIEDTLMKMEGKAA